MKVIPEMYMCEICGNKYDCKESALECESSGQVEYPIGCIYGNHNPKHIYSNITFAVATNKFRGHMNIGGSWACRDTPAGDSHEIGDTCSGGSLFLNPYQARIDENHPTFIRMVAWLQDRKIPVTVWDGKKAVPYPKTETDS